MAEMLSKLTDFGLAGLLLAIVMLAFWQILRTLIRQYQDERDRYWKGADERQLEITMRLADMGEKADQRHVEIMKVLWRMNGGKET